MDISTIVSNCPYPVNNTVGVVNAISWLAVCEAFALNSEPTALPNRHTIINLSEIYFTNIKADSTDYGVINDNLIHIRDLYSAVISITPTP